MLLRDLSGFLNGVECISEYKLSPFLLYGFLFQEKRIQAYLVFLKDMFGNIFLIDIGHVLKDGLFTMDFRNNKLLQRETAPGRERIEEDTFNEFCWEQL